MRKQAERSSVFVLVTHLEGTYFGALYEVKLDGQGNVEILYFGCQVVYFEAKCDGRVLDIKTGKLVSSIKRPAPKWFGTHVSAYGKIYSLSDPYCSCDVPEPSFEEYDPIADSWQPLCSYPYSDEYGTTEIQGYAVCDEVLLFSICGRKDNDGALWAYNFINWRSDQHLVLLGNLVFYLVQSGFDDEVDGCQRLSITKFQIVGGSKINFISSMHCEVDIGDSGPFHIQLCFTAEWKDITLTEEEITTSINREKQPPEPSEVAEQFQQVSILQEEDLSEAIQHGAVSSKVKTGKRCTVKANQFCAVLPDKGLHQYDVSSLALCVYWDSHLSMWLPAYDGRKILYTAGPLPLQSKEFKITPLDDDEGHGLPTFQTAIIAFRSVKLLRDKGTQKSLDERQVTALLKVTSQRSSEKKAAPPPPPSPRHLLLLQAVPPPPPPLLGGNSYSSSPRRLLLLLRRGTSSSSKQRRLLLLLFSAATPPRPPLLGARHLLLLFSAAPPPPPGEFSVGGGVELFGNTQT
ncbi:hypothetical protein ACLB2K_045250 [Fragaria x ananassa]